MKTPDEIKKGLECCIDGFFCRTTCPYTTPFFNIEKCTQAMANDALDLIQQLEADNAQQARCIENLTDKLNAMNDEVAELQAERDAALEDKRGECTYCAYLPGETIPQTCFDCANKGFYRWEWRGVQKEDSNA